MVHTVKKLQHKQQKSTNRKVKTNKFVNLFIQFFTGGCDDYEFKSYIGFWWFGILFILNNVESSETPYGKPSDSIAL